MSNAEALKMFEVCNLSHVGPELQNGVKRYVNEARNEAHVLDMYAVWIGFRSAVHMKHECPDMNLTVTRIED